MHAKKTANRIFTALATGAVAVLASAPALAEDAALITGYSISSEKPPELNVNQDALAHMEHLTDIGLGVALDTLGILPGSDEFQDITQAVEDFFNSARPQDREVEFQSHAILYLPCMMYMVTPTSAMSIRMPPGQETAFMEVYDSTSDDGAFVIELNRDLTATAAVTGQGWESGIQMTPAGGSEELLGYAAKEYNFRYTGGLGGMASADGGPGGRPTMAGLGGLASKITVTTQGTAWVSDDVPGTDIVRSFYQNFSSQISSSQGENSFYGGMMKNMVGMLRHGMPLHTRQKTESKIAGRTQIAGESESWVTGARVISRDTAMCSSSIIPEGVEVMQMGAPSGGGGCDCSCEAFSHLQEMGNSRGGSSDPEAQAMASCMMECASEFMSCAMQMAR